jgi:elongation factor Ts
MITTELIKQLRDETGVSVMQCKKALEEAGGDIEKARIILKKKSGAAAEKKADRELGAGFITSASDENKTVLISLFCETDFVAKNEEFVNAAKKVADMALKSGESAKEESSDMINELIQKMGENIKVGEIKVVSGNTGSYVHNGNIGAVVVLKEKNDDLARDIAMHITAMRPVFTNESDISEADKNNAKEIFQKEVDEQAAGKPEDMKAKILEGKINSYFKDQVLMKQSFIKDPSKTIEQLVKESNNELVSFALEQI